MQQIFLARHYTSAEETVVKNINMGSSFAETDTVHGLVKNVLLTLDFVSVTVAGACRGLNRC